MLFSQKAESSSKAMSQRELRTTDLRVLKVQGIAQLNELYERLGHPGQVSLGLLALQVRRELGSNTGVENLLTLTGGDPTRTSVVLHYVTAQARLQGRARDTRLAQQVQVQLHTGYSRQIQAGLNIALTTDAGDAALRQAIRTLYYSSVVLKQSLVSIIQAALELFDEEGVDEGLRMMRRALADDMAACRPSVPTIKLRTLLTGLQGCTQLSSILHSCRVFTERWSSRERQAELSPVSLLQRLLGYASTGIDSEEVQSLALTVEQLRTLRAGDVLAPEHLLFNADGEGQLRVGRWRIKAQIDDEVGRRRLTLCALEELAVDEVMFTGTGTDVERHEGDEPFETLLVELSVRCGTLKLSLGELRQMAPGMVLSIEGYGTGMAGLYYGDRPIGHGQLVEVDGRLGLQLSRINFSQ